MCSDNLGTQPQPSGSGWVESGSESGVSASCLQDFVLISYDWFEPTSKLVLKVFEDVGNLARDAKADMSLLEVATEGKEMVAYIVKLESGRWMAIALVKGQGCEDGAGNVSAYTFGDGNELEVKSIRSELLKVGVRNGKDYHYGGSKAVARLNDSAIIAIELIKSISSRLVGSGECGSLELEISAIYADTHISVEEIRTNFWAVVNGQQEIYEKLKNCLDLINIRQMARQLDSDSEVSYEDANVFITFLDAAAMPCNTKTSANHESRQVLKNYMDKIGVHFIGTQNWNTVKEIQSEFLLHRNFLHVLTLSEVKEWMMTGYVTVNEFFASAASFLGNIITDLDNLHVTYVFGAVHRNPDKLSLAIPYSMQSRRFEGFDRATATSEIMNIFKKFLPEDEIRLAQFDCGELLFQNTVNVVPLLANFYPGGYSYGEFGSGRLPDNDNRLVQELEELFALRHEIIYAHYLCEDSKNQRKELLAAVCKARELAATFYYGHELFKTFLEINERELTWDQVQAEQLFETKLSELHVNFVTNCYRSSEEMTMTDPDGYLLGYELHEWVQLKIADLQAYVNQNFQLLLLLERTNLPAGEKRDVIELCGQWKQKARFLSTDDAELEEEKLILNIEAYNIDEVIRNRMVSQFIQFDDPKPMHNGQLRAVEMQVLDALAMIQETLCLHPVPNEELADKFKNRFKVVDNSPLAESLRFIPVGDTVYLQLEGDAIPVPVESDAIVMTLLQMGNDAFLRSRFVECADVESVFCDSSVLAYLVEEFLNHSGELGHIRQTLQHGLPVLYPFIVKLLASKCRLIELEPKILLEIARQLFRKESYMKFLVELLHIQEEALVKVLNANSKDVVLRRNIFQTLADELLPDLDEGSFSCPDSMHLLMELHLLQFLEALLERLTTHEVKDEAKRTILRSLLKSINYVAFDWYKRKQDEEEIKEAVLILTQTLRMISEGNVFVDPEPEILTTRRILMKLHKKLKQYEQAMQICKTTHTELGHFFNLRGLPTGADLEDDILLKIYGKYLLNFSDTAYAHRLLGAGEQAYTWLDTLYREIIVSCGSDPRERFTAEQYAELNKSDVYRKLCNLSEKYLNILRVVTDNLYQKSRNSGGRADLGENLELLEIHSTVYQIRETELGAEHADTTVCVKGQQYTEYFVGWRYFEMGDYHRACEYYQSSLEKVKFLLQTQIRRLGSLNPAVEHLRDFQTKNSSQLAMSLKKLGLAERRRRNETQACKYFESALGLYREVGEYQLKAKEFGEHHEFTMRTLKAIEDMNDIVANPRGRNRSESKSVPEWRRQN